jgi:four helix bundle protein
MEQKEYILADQLLRSGTSIGANIEEGISAQSKNDFIAKLSVSLKEANESYYWLRLIEATNTFSDDQVNLLIRDCEELIAMLTAILRTSRINQSK